MRYRVFAIAVAVGMVAGCAAEPEPSESAESAAPAAEALPAMITAERGGFIPEGVEYDTANGRLLTGSLSEGSIFQIHPDGRVTTLVADADLVSSVGIEADEDRNRLLVANADRSVFQAGGAGQAKLGVYNLTTGERIAMVDLAAVVADAPKDAAYFANDVAVGSDGTAYVTDTRMNVIYRVGTDYTASVLHRFPRNASGPNGIVYHPSGYLLAGGGAALWKIRIADSVEATQVKLPEEVPGQDGIIWTADGRLAIVSNSGNRVVALTSSDDWATAQLAGVAAYETQATTVAAVGDDLYVVHPHFADEDPPSFERVALQ